MCPSCRSNNQAEFASEMMVHLSGNENRDDPGVWVSSKLLVCLDCGYSHLAVPERELESIVHTLQNESST